MKDIGLKRERCHLRISQGRHTRITLNHNLFRRFIQELDRDPAAVLMCSAGISRLRDATTLLAYTFERVLLGALASHRLVVCGGVDPPTVALSIRRALTRVTDMARTAILSLVSDASRAMCLVSSALAACTNHQTLC
jgi:hypothetical protein